MDLKFEGTDPDAILHAQGKYTWCKKYINWDIFIFRIDLDELSAELKNANFSHTFRDKIVVRMESSLGGDVGEDIRENIHIASIIAQFATHQEMLQKHEIDTWNK